MHTIQDYIPVHVAERQNIYLNDMIAAERTHVVSYNQGARALGTTLLNL